MPEGLRGNVVARSVQNLDHFKVSRKGNQVEPASAEALAPSLEPAPEPAPATQK